MEPLDDAVDHVRGSAAGRLDVARFDSDRTGTAVLERVRRDVESGMASGEVRGTPTLFIDGVVHQGAYDTAALLEALAR
jgi:predicted DsbA family dithiol-disulfide isomerase